MNLEVHHETIGEILVIALKGQLFASSAKELGFHLHNLVGDYKKLLFDLSQLSQLDYDGLRALLSFLSWAHHQGCVSKLAALQPAPRILIDITRISQAFDCPATLEDGIQAFQISPPQQ